MRSSSLPRALLVGLVALLALGALAGPADAGHSWGNYHWPRQANPFTVALGHNVSATWDGYLATTSSDWTESSVLDAPVVAGGTNPRSCRPTSGRVEVCSAEYGYTGWLGVAQIWVSGDHIAQGTAKVNDTYFNSEPYNTPAWRNLVMCQEVGHTFGLDHQDENFDNPNLGTCMDYTSNPDGPPSNEHPNAHDYEQLEAIYAHADGSGGGGGGPGGGRPAAAGDTAAEWGQAIRWDAHGQPILFVRDLGAGQLLFTWVFWAR